MILKLTLVSYENKTYFQTSTPIIPSILHCLIYTLGEVCQTSANTNVWLVSLSWLAATGPSFPVFAWVPANGNKSKGFIYLPQIFWWYGHRMDSISQMFGLNMFGQMLRSNSPTCRSPVTMMYLLLWRNVPIVTIWGHYSIIFSDNALCNRAAVYWNLSVK